MMNECLDLDDEDIITFSSQRTCHVRNSSYRSC